MEKLKNLFNGLSGRISRTLRQYTGTMILVFSLSLIAAVLIDRNDALAEKLMTFVFIWGVGTYFSETFFPGKKLYKWSGIILSCGIAAGLRTGRNG